MIFGSLDKRGNACLKFNLCGVADAPPGPEYLGIIDTGFTGFISLPLQYAFALQLPLFGTSSATLADGSQITCLTALGAATLQSDKQTGVIWLEPKSQDLLIGMDFLRQFKLSLVIAKGIVCLLEEDWLEKAIGAANQEAKKTAEQNVSDAADAAAEAHPKSTGSASSPEVAETAQPAAHGVTEEQPATTPDPTSKPKPARGK